MLSLGFFYIDVETELVVINRSRIDLQNVEEARAHELAELLIQHIRTIGFAAQFLKAVNEIART